MTSISPSPFALSTHAHNAPEKLWPISHKMTGNMIESTPSYSDVAMSVQTMLYQPSLKWIGKVFDWFFDPSISETASVENRNISIKKSHQTKNSMTASRMHREALTSFLSEMEKENGSQSPSRTYEIKPGFPKNLGSHQSRKTRDDADVMGNLMEIKTYAADCEIDHVAADGLFSGQCYFHASCPMDITLHLTASWSISLNTSLDELSLNSNDPAQFVPSLLNCINSRIVYPYTFAASEYGLDAECISIPGTVKQTVDLFVLDWNFYDPMNRISVIYYDQNEKLKMPPSIGTDCYLNNLIQEVNTQPDPIIEYFDSLECATGSYNVQYFDAFCTRRYVLESFTLILPIVGNDPISDLCICSANELITYFNNLEKVRSQGCGNLTPQSSFNISLAQGGLVVFQSPSGLFYDQIRSVNSLSSDLQDAIQQCYNNALSNITIVENSSQSEDNSKINPWIYLTPLLIVPFITIEIIRQKFMSNKIKEKDRLDELKTFSSKTETDV